MAKDKKLTLAEMKTMDEKALVSKIVSLKADLASMMIDKNINKLTDVKAPVKLKRQVAQLATVLRQKQLIKEYQNNA